MTPEQKIARLEADILQLTKRLKAMEAQQKDTASAIVLAAHIGVLSATGAIITSPEERETIFKDVRDRLKKMNGYLRLDLPQDDADV